MDFLDTIASTLMPRTYDNNIKRADLKRFEADPNYIVDPSRYANPDKGLELNDRLKSLRAFQQEQQAAPILNDLSAFKRDPQFQDPASLAVLATDSPLGTTQKNADGTWGERPGLSNPLVQKGLSAFAQGSENTLDAFRAGQSDPMAIARVSQNKELASGFEQASQGADRFAKPVREQASTAAQQKFMEGLPGVYAAAVDDQPAMLAALSKATGVDPKFALDSLKQVQSQNVVDKPDGYKQRDYLKGDVHVYEESKDGGRTWVPLSEARRYKPATGNNREGPVAQSQFVDPETGKPLVFDKKTGSYRIAKIEGGVTPKPAAFTPEAAAKAQLVEQGLTYIPKIREGLYDANGKIDRSTILAIGLRTPFTKGRELSTYILDAVEAKLRAESGAAVPEPEVKRAAKRFVPQAADSDSTIKIKIDNLEKFLKGTSDKINNGRNKTGTGNIAKTVVEQRVTADGRTLVKYSDGSIGQR